MPSRVWIVMGGLAPLTLMHTFVEGLTAMEVSHDRKQRDVTARGRDVRVLRDARRRIEGIIVMDDPQSVMTKNDFGDVPDGKLNSETRPKIRLGDTIPGISAYPLNTFGFLLRPSTTVLFLRFKMAATATQRVKCTIHVSSLPAETNKDLLLAAFIPFGEIVDIQIPLNEEGTSSSLPYFPSHSSSLSNVVDGSIRGFAYIEYESSDDAEEAIFNMNDSELYNRVIKVDVAKPHRGLAGLDTTLPGMSLFIFEW